MAGFINAKNAMSLNRYCNVIRSRRNLGMWLDASGQAKAEPAPEASSQQSQDALLKVRAAVIAAALRAACLECSALECLERRGVDKNRSHSGDKHRNITNTSAVTVTVLHFGNF